MKVSELIRKLTELSSVYGEDVLVEMTVVEMDNEISDAYYSSSSETIYIVDVRS